MPIIRMRKLFMRTTTPNYMKSILVLTLAFLGLWTELRADDRPNIVWIIPDDMSANFSCYGETAIQTPHVDALARRGVKFTRAFVTAPVCSTCRSAFITGMYQTSIGAHHHRSGRGDQKIRLPKHIQLVPALFQKAGYHTSITGWPGSKGRLGKTDYNFEWNPSVYDSSDWANRKPGQPFFAQIQTPGGKLRGKNAEGWEKIAAAAEAKLGRRTPLEAVKLPPYYPDTTLVRRELARFYDCVTAMDLQVGAILKQLQEDGLAENTIVFFYSDHGSGMPRHKRALLDSGMHVPLLIRFPKKWQHLAPGKPGTTTDRLVSFVDYAPTVLNLLGQPIPEAMQGEPFLGPNNAKPRRYVYGHRDRVDEVRDLSRSVRDERYLYIRNYMPHLGYNQPTAWPDSGEIRHDFYRMTNKEKMTDAQWHFAGPTRPVEELYDCQTDPQNLNNLVGSKKHRNILKQLRAEHIRHITETADLGFLPESEAWKLFDKHTGWELGQAGRVPLDSIHQAAAQVGLASEREFLSYLESANPTIRYWGAMGLAVRPKISGLAKRTKSPVR